MPQPSRPDAQKASIKARVEEKLRQGHRPPGLTGSGQGAISAAAIEAAAEGEFQTPKAFITAAYGLTGDWEPDWTLFHAGRYQQPVPRLLLLPAETPRPQLLTGRISRKVAIPDRHNDPRHPHRLEATLWISRYCSDVRPEEIIDLGDSVSMDSCSRYDKNDTIRGRQKPGIRADLDNHLAMLQMFERGRAADYKPKLRRVRGNHESRLFEFENQHPEDEGTHTHRYAQELLQFGWQERPFGEIYYSDGVGFSHAPMANGKPVGGKTGPLRASNDLCRSLVHGHTHKFHWYDAPKNDPVDKISVISAGCALPHGEVEHYATHGGATGWRYGILDMTVCDGEIIGHRWVDMRELRNLYSDDGADVRAA